MQASLENLGVHAATLSVADIAGGRLAGYDVVVLGVRAYSAHRDPGGSEWAASGVCEEWRRGGGAV